MADRVLKLRLSLGMAGDDVTGEVELPDNWDDMSETSRTAWCDEELDDLKAGHLEASYEIGSPE